MARHIGVAIIGGGQAGLAMSQVLGAGGVDHVVFERGRIGQRWHSERWPSLRLLTPDWMMRLPGFAAETARPGGFMRALDFAGRLEDYALRWSMPVFEETEVLGLTHRTGGFGVSTSAGDWQAKAVVIATGACDRPYIPGWARSLSPAICQISPSEYRGAEALPEGGVLVVGASATGVQFAEEIQRSGRQVILAAGRHVRTPRHYRGRDIYEWLDACNFFCDAPEGDPARLRSAPSFQLIGRAAGPDLDLAYLSSLGVRITGRAETGRDYRIRLAGDLEAQCAAAEARRRKILRRIDEHIDAAGLDASADPDAWTPPRSLPAAPADLDLAAQNVRTIVWATGYRRDYSWLNLPVLGADGEISQHSGVTPVPGLYTLGLPFMRRRGSAMIDGAGRDAQEIGSLILQQLHQTTARAAA